MAQDARTARADAKAEKARAKAMRPWFKKKRFILPLALVVVIVIAVIASAGGSKKSNTSSTAVFSGGGNVGSAAGTLYPNRPDRQKKDHEARIGEGVDLVGYTVTLKDAAFKQKISDFEDKGYIVSTVTILNRNKGSQPYNVFDFKLQTPNGQVIDPSISSGQSLGSGDLVSGGTASGQVVWEVGTQKGDFYVIYKPKPFDASRGIWGVTV
jgi:hypothetical protein